jgi:hypothetical protein
MEEIPESGITTVDGWLPPDVEAVALECVKDMAAFDPPVIARRIARAILAERERAAKIVAQYGDHPNGAVAFVSDEIAVAIRYGAHHDH